MKTHSVQAPNAPQATGNYSQALEISSSERLLFVSGQIPETADGEVPADFAGQCRLVWANVEAQVRAAGMSLDNLVKVTTFLSDRRHGPENSAIRQEVLGDRRPALTVVVAGIYDERWLLEIEAIAAA
ncbi:MAG TPA: RidA family protein [Thermoanaerobaculia bacterium]|jgi:enamine deaminase RidA (YjgF/YER057c/UK114 family)|nr:RidA family protein [Thermoanaerobaculia bacterium]